MSDIAWFRQLTLTFCLPVVREESQLLGWGLYYRTWVNEQTAYWFSTPEAWRLEDPKKFRALMYQRARGIWELAMELGDPYGL
jgi:hypothetical protein